jgi:phosphoribosylglycinamide formyltransferase-1
MTTTRVAVLASGEGTTAEALIRACIMGSVDCEVGLVISTSRSAGVLGRVEGINRELGTEINLACVGPKSHPVEEGELARVGDQTSAEANAVGSLLRDGCFDLVVLMGYLKRGAPSIVHEYGWRPEYQSVYEARMLNIHPGPLPETKGLYGLSVQERVLSSRPVVAGHVVHVVAENYDDGPVIAEHPVPVVASDTPETLSQRVRSLQREQVPGDIATFAAARGRYLRGFSSRTGAAS